ncbi:hypothetical protein E9998_16840 [Glycomyces paridis]|uniref:Uncharacterized protein n=1 Tax=Glycomyces paridis TaxID=2126555 RepID=A0A4S8PA29_9ACTN|nr:hypothetical protein E9998_16840 [Glycomyces paridis]
MTYLVSISFIDAFLGCGWALLIIGNIAFTIWLIRFGIKNDREAAEIPTRSTPDSRPPSRTSSLRRFLNRFPETAVVQRADNAWFVIVYAPENDEELQVPIPPRLIRGTPFEHINEPRTRPERMATFRRRIP